MRHHVRVVGFLVGMITAAFELQACVSDAEMCEQNGTCVKGGGGGGSTGSAGNSGGNGGTTTTVPCSDHPECGGTCEGGVPQFTPAGVLCDGYQVCDGEGKCVACEDNIDPCPEGYECNGGVCGLSPGGPCSDNTMCASGFCVGGHCCADACEGDCRSCDAETGFICKRTDRLSTHPTCEGPGEVCDGEGHCKLLGSAKCTTDDQCLSGTCSDNNTTNNTNDDKCTSP